MNSFNTLSFEKVSRGAIQVTLKGYLGKGDKNSLAGLVDDLNPEMLKEKLCSLFGNYAISVENDSSLLLVADRVRSFPLYFFNTKDGLAHAFSQKELSTGCEGDFDLKQTKLFAMSAYTLGNKTLLKNISSLCAGEYLLHDKKSGETIVEKYYEYLPKIDDMKGDRAFWMKEAAQVTMNVMKDMVRTAQGREIVVPLSAGNDSRLVVSALKELGYQNVKTFSYGLKGNFESEFAEKIAKKLGYPYKFFELTNRLQREFFKSSLHEEYIDFSTDYIAVPFEQDVSIIDQIKQSGWVTEDAIFVNGNSGDYISGAHIPAKINQYTDRREVQEYYFQKHFSLWERLKTGENKKVVFEYLDQSLSKKKEQYIQDIDLWEEYELLNRQTKYVINGQRSYEFFGYDWRLPLWHEDYLEFWRQVPKEFKIGQLLYKEMLLEQNWGGVWKHLPVNDKKITPSWIRPLRLLVKPFFIFSRESWHRFEKRFFLYWMDIICSNAIVSYWEVITNKNGARHGLSWYTMKALERMGLGYNGKK